MVVATLLGIGSCKCLWSCLQWIVFLSRGFLCVPIRRCSGRIFLLAVDRLGSVSAAARESGINRETGQGWARAAGIRRLRRYTRSEKDLFFAALERAGNVCDAARELGIHINTAKGWVHCSGPAAEPGRAAPGPVVSAGPPRTSVKQLHYFQLRRAGISPKRAATAAGAPIPRSDTFPPGACPPPQR